MSVFAGSSQAEILRSSQKDELYLQHLRGETTSIFRSIFGIQRWLKYKNYVDLGSDFLYYSLTTLSGLQTLGEEYVNIIQTNSVLKQVPSLLARILSTTCYISCPFLLQLALRQLQKNLEQLPDDHLPELLRNRVRRERVIALLHGVQKLIPTLQKVHSVMFFIFGTYYHVSKRLFGIRYVLLRSWLKDSKSKSLYRFLGLLSFLQFVISAAIELASHESKLASLVDTVSDGRSAQTSTTVDGKDKCPLCLSKRSATTATPCGHLFCWTCITNWMDKRKECPLCRDQFALSRLVCLQNFD